MPVTYRDENGHLWPSVEPGDTDVCGDCGLVAALRSGLKCSSTWMGPATPRVQEADAQWDKIEKWLRATFEADLQGLKDKADEYGGYDFVIMGKSMEALLPAGADLDRESRERAGLEMAIGFYLMGKTSRLFSAWQMGREPRGDTWHDGTIYTYIGRYVREHGRWMS
jgi:hypothetical protein